MHINPVSEEKASEETKRCYEDLKLSLESYTLPIFFSYLGAFPEYLQYINEQLVINLKDPAFKKMMIEQNSTAVKIIQNILPKSENIRKWYNLYKDTPTFYYFQNDLMKISIINTKITCIFIALREAVKGWAVAAKKLSESTTRRYQEEEEMSKGEFIFDSDLVRYYQEKYEKNGNGLSNFNQQAKSPSAHSTSLSHRTSTAIEKNILPDYLRLCEIDIKNHMKHDYFWIMRVQLEEQILAILDLLPNLIFSPYNVIVKLTQQYENFYDLLYLLSEDFPTLAMQRLIFSGFMMIR